MDEDDVIAVIVEILEHVVQSMEYGQHRPGFVRAEMREHGPDAHRTQRLLGLINEKAQGFDLGELRAALGGEELGGVIFGGGFLQTDGSSRTGQVGGCAGRLPVKREGKAVGRIVAIIGTALLG